MTDMNFDPGTNLGDEIINMNRQELCELVSRLCVRIKAECGSRSYRGGIYPENISINSAGEIQLGLARSDSWEGQELEFLAPELYWNGKKSQASDVYSLGMVLYYALNKGKLPYEGECDNPQLKRMNGEEFPLPKAAGRRLGEIIRKATQFKSEDRYQSVEELQIMLDNCVNNQYLEGQSGAKAIFNKDEAQLSDMEKLMVGIIENGEEEPAPEETQEENVPEEASEEAAPEESSEEPAPAEESPENKEEPEKAETAGSEKPAEDEELKVYEPVKKKKPSKSAAAPQKREPIPILTEEKNPSLEPVVLRSRNTQPAVQYGKTAKQEENAPEQIKKRRSRRLASVLIICAIIVVTAIIVNKLLDDISWSKDEPDNEIGIVDELPTIGAENKNDIGLMPTPSPVVLTPSPSPTPEPPKEHRYQLIMEDISWTAARDKCLEMGGYLVVINDEAELKKVTELASDAGLERIWIGCRRANDELVWENGEKVDFYPAPWGEPGQEPSYEDTDGTPEDYLMLWNNEGWSYNDSRNDPVRDYPQFYSGTIGYICEFND